MKAFFSSDRLRSIWRASLGGGKAKRVAAENEELGGVVREALTAERETLLTEFQACLSRFETLGASLEGMESEVREGLLGVRQEIARLETGFGKRICGIEENFVSAGSVLEALRTGSESLKGELERQALTVERTEKSLRSVHESGNRRVEELEKMHALELQEQSLRHEKENRRLEDGLVAVGQRIDDAISRVAPPADDGNGPTSGTSWVQWCTRLLGPLAVWERGRSAATQALELRQVVRIEHESLLELRERVQAIVRREEPANCPTGRRGAPFANPKEHHQSNPGRSRNRSLVPAFAPGAAFVSSVEMGS